MRPKLLMALAVIAAPVFPGGHAAAAPVGQSDQASAATASRAFPQLLHVGFAATDSRQAAARTIRALGLPPSSLVADLDFPVHGGRYKGAAADFTVHLTIVDTGNTQLEYIQPLTGTSPYSDALAGGAEVVAHHLAYIVPSIEARLAIERQINPGIEVVIDAPIGTTGRYVYVRGVLPGLLVEFIETRGSPPPSAH